MKKSTFLIVTLAFAFIFSSEAFSQKFQGLDKSPMDVASYPASHQVFDKLVKVIYSRPQLKGRTLTKLVPQGKIWRTAANEATEIVFYKDVNFGGKNVKAGRYTLFTIPNENKWTIILSTAKNVWGAYSYKESEDVVRVHASVSKSKKTIEAFTITFDKKNNAITMYLGWAHTIVNIPIKG